jgi:hypothetical protein
LVWVKTMGFRRGRGKVKPVTRLWVRETTGDGDGVWASREAWKRVHKAGETAFAV